jgi:hypothetical protein
MGAAMDGHSQRSTKDDAIKKSNPSLRSRVAVRVNSKFDKGSGYSDEGRFGSLGLKQNSNSNEIPYCIS